MNRKPKTLFDRKYFFDYVRENLYGGKLSQGEVEGMRNFLDYWEKEHAEKDKRLLAYILATAYHEVNRTFRPIKEFGGDNYFFNMYDIEGRRPHVARDLGNVAPGDGVLFHGRGYVQLTGRANYAKWEKRLGVDLTSSRRAADRVLNHDIAMKIIVEGSLMGDFTGKKLTDYIQGPRQDFKNARRVINRLDKASLIASYATHFLEALG